MRIKCKPGVIPTEFSNDMTYYEQICKMLDKINELVDKYNAFNPNDYVETVSTKNVVYATDNEGKNTTIKYGAEIANRNGIVQRDGQQVLVPLAPSSDYHATSKKYVDTTKVSRGPLNNKYKVYTQLASGADSTAEISKDIATPNTFVQRDDNGCIVCADPVDDNDAVNLRYAQNNLIPKNIIDVGTISKNQSGQYIQTLPHEVYDKLTDNCVIGFNFVDGTETVYITMPIGAIVNDGSLYQFLGTYKLAMGGNSSRASNTLSVLIMTDRTFALTIDPGAEVPVPSSVDAGKIPVVSDDGRRYDLEDKPEGIPGGGTTGQVLTKDSDGNATWQSPTGGIVPVSVLPTANEAEYNKHALYLYDESLNYIVSKTVMVPGTPTVETLSETLPSARYGTSAAAVGTDCYVFGGISGATFDKIVKFDTISQTVTTLSATLPSVRYGTSAAAVGTDCYVFGGKSGGSNLNEIVKFDTISQTVTTLSAVLPNGRFLTSAAAVDTDCYVFGGYGGGYLNGIVKFDTISQTVTLLSATLPSAREDTSAAAVGTDCYVFGGEGSTGSFDEIVKFDTISQTVTTLSITLPSVRKQTSAAAVGTDCYVFGGRSGGDLDKIVKFDTISQTVTTLSVTLPSARYDTSAAAVGTDCYVFGGYRSIASGLNQIVKIDTYVEHSSIEYSYKTLLNKGDTTYTETENSQGGTTVSDAIVVKYENGKQTAVIA